ncbi:MAG: hypothetical protein DLM58_17270 [Pseudonocardiales bacterium]|nr:MAG: hypothetical protein DLM58_17270 [Pseudonocardiales bacterium]
MTNIQAYDGLGSTLASFSPSARLMRRTSRQLDQIDARTTVGIAQIESVAELQAVKVDAVAHVGRRAMQDVALLSQVEMQLATATPHASGRLATIADLTAVAMSDVVLETARRIGRCG